MHMPSPHPLVSALNRPLSLFLALMLVLTTLLLARPVFQPSSVESSTASILETYGQLPLTFEANQGQTDGQVKFLSRGSGYGLFLTTTEAVLALSKLAAPKTEDKTDLALITADAEESQAFEQAVLRMQLVGANSQPQVVGLEELPGKVNYFIGNDPQKWQTNIPTFARVKYEEVYPGVDLVYYGNQGQLEYDFVVAPGADLEAITLGFQGIDKLEVDTQGDLVLHIASEQVRMHKPLVYQEVNGVRQEISGGYVLKNKYHVGFHLDSYDASRPLVIDPVLIYSTYLGGSVYETVWDIAADSSGNAYVVGETSSPDFPTMNPLQSALHGVADAYVTKLNAAGDALVYSTYLGGSLYEESHSIAVDASGNAYVTGGTGSGDFPLLGSPQPPLSGGNVFVTKLSAMGDLIYSVALGGSFNGGEGIAVDSSGNAYITGRTRSSFPTVNAIQDTLRGEMDGFVAKLNAAGNSLIYSTYLGGSGGDEPRSIAADSAGNAYVTGFTSSTDFPTANAIQPTFAGRFAVFVTKLNPTGSALVYSTYLGGSRFDYGEDIAVDSEGNAYVTGRTGSSSFPIANALQPTLNGLANAFVTKLNPTGSALVYSTYLGGSIGEDNEHIAIDSEGNVYVAGQTQSTDFPTVNPLQPTLGENSCILEGGEEEPPTLYCFPSLFVVKLNPAGSALVYSTYFGGSVTESISGIAVDSFGNAHLTGYTNSTDFPIANALQPTSSSGQKVFVAKIFPGNTSSGSNVIVSPNSTTTVTFASVSSLGDTTVTTNSTGPIPPAGFSLGDPPIYYDISTTAIYNPPVTVCITYDPTQYSNPNNLRLLHYENNAWVDVTTSNDTTNHAICGQVSNLSLFAVVERVNRPPSANAGGPYTVDEGDSVVVAASGSDPEGGALTFAWDLDNNGTFETPSQSVTFSAAGLDGSSSHMIAVQATDSGGLLATDQATVNVLNVAPTVGAITAPVSPVQVNSAINTSADFTDPGMPDTHTTVWDWGDNSTSPGTVNETSGSGSVTGGHTYTTPGVHTVRAMVTDDDGDSGESIFQFVVVYDPSAGFVTGGGWIDSPAGAYAPDPLLTGTATFGFVSRYKKGTTVPTGVTEFQFQVAGLNFRSDTYDWLVVAGVRAQYKGTGTINGQGEYKFLLTAIDADVNTNDSITVDRFRIKIWWEEVDGTEHVVYDNGLDAEDFDEIDPTTGTTEIGGGSIVIHKGS